MKLYTFAKMLARCFAFPVKKLAEREFLTILETRIL